MLQQLLVATQLMQKSLMQGLQHTVVFCGDGINDLSAMSSAGIGYAVGATEASVAVSI